MNAELTQFLSTWGGALLLLPLVAWSIVTMFKHRDGGPEVRPRPLRLTDGADGSGAAVASFAVPAFAMAFSGAVGYGLYLLIGPNPSFDGLSRLGPAELFGALIILGFLLVGPASLIHWCRVSHEYRNMVSGQLLISAAPIAPGRPVTLTFSRQFYQAETLESFSARIVAGRLVRRHERSVFETVRAIALDAGAAQLKDGVLKAVWEVTLEPPELYDRKLGTTGGANPVFDVLAEAVNTHGMREPLLWRLEVQMSVAGFPADDSLFGLPVAPAALSQDAA